MVWTEVYAAACASSEVLPNAGSALRYFLTKGEEGKTDNCFPSEGGLYTEGHTRREIPIEIGLIKSSDMENTLKSKLNSIMTVCEQICVRENVPVTFYDIEEA